MCDRCLAKANQDTCDHEPDPACIHAVDDDVDEEGRIVVDVKCRKCGRMGSYGIDPAKLEWE